MRQACEGIAAAHAAGILHRHICPANILVTDGDLVKVGFTVTIHQATVAPQSWPTTWNLERPSTSASAKMSCASTPSR
jgi:serine/threonine protein kinase